MRFRTTVTSAVALAAALLGAAPALAAGPASTQLTGTYQLLAADAGINGLGGDTYRSLLTVGDRSYTLTLPAGVHLQGGSTVTLTGIRSGRSLRVTHALVRSAPPRLRLTGGPTPTSRHVWRSPLGRRLQRTTRLPAQPSAGALRPRTTTSTPAPAPSVPPAAARTNVLVILADWTAPDTVTQASAAQTMFTDADQWYRENSYGALGLTGAVTPWVHIAGPASGLCYTNSAQIMSQAKAAALALGYDATTYDRTVVYFPFASNADCSSYTGWAYQPGNQVWINGAMSKRTATHEQGHNYGLGHAHSYTCMSGGVQVTLSSSCTSTEYGDPVDAMGSAGFVGHYSAPEKAQLGWLSGSRLADLSTGGAATLSPYEQGSGTLAVKVTTGARTYWLERRTLAGFDSLLPTALVSGAVVTLTDPAIANANGLLDMTPDGNFRDATLAPGGSWTTPEGITITLGALGADGLPVTVTVPGAVPPTPTATPTSTPSPVDTTPPGEVSNLRVALSKRAVLMSWTNPGDSDLAQVVVRQQAGLTAPQSIVSGTGDYAGLGSSLSLPLPARNGSISLRIFTVDRAGNASVGRTVTINGGAVSQT